MNWISVKDELPEEGAEVLITDGTKVDVSFCQLTYGGDDPNEKNWFNRIYFGYFGCVTHWQPLPEPPNVKPKISQSDFIKQYCDKGNIIERQLNDLGEFALPCNCGEPECHGWAMTTLKNIKTHIELYLKDD